MTIRGNDPQRTGSHEFNGTANLFEMLLSAWPVQAVFGAALVAFGIWFAFATGGMIVGSAATLIGGGFLLKAARTVSKRTSKT